MALDSTQYSETFTRDNDYSLSAHSRTSSYESGMTFSSRITRTFNFLAQQVTTVTRDMIYQPAPSYQSGGSSSVTATTTVQRFDEFQSDAEIRLMRQKLVDMGGHPPEIEITPGKQPTLRQPAA